MGFIDFSTYEGKAPSNSLIAKCGACGLHKDCISPKIQVQGEGRRKILIVQEYPEAIEDQRGQFLISESNQFVRTTLRNHGIDADRDCWLTSSVICHTPEGRFPNKNEIDYCRPNLKKALKELDPISVILLGYAACKSMLVPYWKEDIAGNKNKKNAENLVERWVGWAIPLQARNCWVFPTYNPSWVISGKDERLLPVKKLWFDRHIAIASQFDQRPWEEVPDFASQVRVVINPEDAARWIREKIDAGGPIAFDYETNCLKPDFKGSEIVCCSICWKGVETIAYPWVGEAIKASKEILESPVPKIGANNKFETLWSWANGINVQNWGWDCMQSAHHLDCREGITSVKFQALVRYGLSDWSKKIKPYLEAAKGVRFNRIREVNLRDLLIYNGIDSLIEYKIAIDQKKEMMCK